MTMTTYNAVFKGGGAKGVAYAGALQACERAGLEFAAVAGSSAGAITAALVACGYRADDMLAMMPGALRAIGSPRRGAVAVGRSSLLSSSGLRRWTAEAVADRVRPGWRESSSAPPRVTFGELASVSDIELFVVTMDLATRQPLVLCARLTPDMAVADAVVASSAIPVAFPAARLVIGDEVHRVVDGGTWANYPSFVFRDRDFRSYHGLEPTSLPTIGFVLDTVVAEEPTAGRSTRRARGPAFATDRGSAYDEFGAWGALAGAGAVRVVASVAPLLFVVFAVLSLVRESAAGFPFFSGLWDPVEDPALLLTALLVGLASVVSVVAAFVGLRLGRELLDTGAVGAVAAMGVGPSVPYWVRTRPDHEDHVVVRIVVPPELSTLSFSPGPFLVRQAVTAGWQAALRSLATAGVIPMQPWMTDPDARPDDPRPVGVLDAVREALLGGGRSVGRWAATGLVLLAATFWLASGFFLVVGGGPRQAVLGVGLLAGVGVALGYLVVRHAGRRARQARRNTPFPALGRLPSAALWVVVGVSSVLTLGMLVAASVGHSAVALSRAETTWARVADVAATGEQSLAVPATVAEAAALARARPDLAEGLDLPVVGPDRLLVAADEIAAPTDRVCSARDSHCLVVRDGWDAAVGDVVPLLVDRRGDRLAVLDSSVDPSTTLRARSSMLLVAMGLVALALRCGQVATWRRSRQSLVDAVHDPVPAAAATAPPDGSAA